VWTQVEDEGRRVGEARGIENVAVARKS
jgi:hypothetical protein